MSHLRSALAIAGITAIGLAFALLACGPAVPEPDGDVPVRVGRVLIDARSHSPVIILEEVGGDRSLPIWIGTAEADSIHRRLENLPSVRPDSHDLASRLIDRLDAQLDHVVVTELSKGIFYAQMVLRSAGDRVEIDSRPSDAIAIALRAEAPVFVRAAVFEKATRDDEPGNRDEGAVDEDRRRI